jgi:DNA-binding NtrC family response regulator
VILAPLSPDVQQLGHCKWPRICVDRSTMTRAKYDEVVAVINSSEDTVEMLRLCLTEAGFTSVVEGHVRDFKTGAEDVTEYLRRYNPTVLVYDVSIPYDKNWNFLRLLLDSASMRGRKIVVTTTNKKRLEELVGPTNAFEIVGKPYDLDQIVTAVKGALGKE